MPATRAPGSPVRSRTPSPSSNSWRARSSADPHHQTSTVNDTRNPHVGAPFTDDDAAIAAALEDVSVPILLCSLVHMTGDPSWIRDVSLAQMPGPMDLQGGLDDDVLADRRRRAVPAIAASRDGGCVPHELPQDVVVEM